MEEGQRHRLTRRVGGAARTDRRAGIMLDRFGDAEEDQADAHAGAEQHREPGDIAIVRLAVVRAQLDIAMPAEHQIEDKQQEAGHRGDIEPAEVPDHDRLYLTENQTRLLRQQGAVQGKRQNQPRGHEKYRRIDLYAGAVLGRGGLRQDGIGQGRLLFLCSGCMTVTQWRCNRLQGAREDGGGMMAAGKRASCPS